MVTIRLFLNYDARGTVCQICTYGSRVTREGIQVKRPCTSPSGLIEVVSTT